MGEPEVKPLCVVPTSDYSVRKNMCVQRESLVSSVSHIAKDFRRFCNSLAKKINHTSHIRYPTHHGH